VNTSDALLERLQRLHPRVIDLSLGRIERLLAALGHPERRLPPVVHIAGTNGKGSTLAYLRAIFEEAGRSVHAYTSPHLVRFHERIRIAGTLIQEDALAALLAECEASNKGEPITFFEITTAAAFLAFARTPAEVLLLEVGLGGRLDATNVIPPPVLTVITPVALDHQHFLGETLAAIAGEKAGILKPGVPCVVGPQEQEGAAAIEARARDLESPLFRHGAEWRVAANGTGLAHTIAGRTRTLPTPGLPGAHQIANAGIAVSAAHLLSERFGIPDTAIAAGVLLAEWPGRLQRLARGRLSALLPPGCELWLDGGHNPHAGEALAGMLDQWAGKTHLVVGMIDTKDHAAFLAPLARRAASVIAVPVPHAAQPVPPEALAKAARAAGAEAETADDVPAALARLAARRPSRVLICGSLYLAGAVLARNG
jgi:dihydrofolate synthase / folylpolyglutamate synthase